jgi:subtilisin family serine protease
MKKLLLLLSILFVQQSYSQIQDAWVFFADKEDVDISINNPISILTQEAIDRKEMHNIPIDERDVPVNEDYITQIKNANGITVYSKSKWMNCAYIRGTQANIEDLLDLSFVIGVEYADKDLNLFPIPGRIDDKFEIENMPSRIVYNYGAAANQIEMLAGDFLHEQDFTGTGMIVAVLDAGFPSVNTNPGFSEIINEGRLLGTYDFVYRQVGVDGTSSHGTKTSSDIGGFLIDQFVGTAPEASFYFFVTEYVLSENPVEEAYWVEGLERADSLGVDVVNTSLSYRDYDNSNYTHTYEDFDGQTTFAARGGNIAFEKGMLLVSSAGNSGSSGFPWVATPADSPGVLTIGAVTSNGSYASFSSIGPTVDGRIKPDVMAQGQNSAVINTSGNVDFNSGTSFSSPIMAGAVACLWQSRPEVPNGLIMQVIRESAHLYNNPTNQMGYGIPNFEDAYNALQILGIEDEFLLSNFALYPNPVSFQVNVSFPEGIINAHFSLYNILGKRVLQTEISLDQKSVEMSHLNRGMYIATIESEGNSISFKLIKE